jgi:hypothetical protein
MQLSELVAHDISRDVALEALEGLVGAGELEEPLRAARHCPGALRGLDLGAPRGPAQSFLATLLRRLAHDSEQAWMSRRETRGAIRLCGLDERTLGREGLERPDFHAEALLAHLASSLERWGTSALDPEALAREGADCFPRSLCALAASDVHRGLQDGPVDLGPLQAILGRGALSRLRRSFPALREAYHPSGQEGFEQALAQVPQEEWLHCLEVGILGTSRVRLGQSTRHPRWARQDRARTLASFSERALKRTLLRAERA